MTKTLLFCTAFAPDHNHWRRRYPAWLQGIRSSGLRYDQLLLVDDCSPFLPNWPGLTIVSADGGMPPNTPLVMACFPTHLGKIAGRTQGHAVGWYRSFAYAAHYARAGDFTRIIHIESDASVISPRLVTYINAIDIGWTALWCPYHAIPEDNIQIIGGSSLAEYFDFVSHPYSTYDEDAIERQYPFTHVERRFIGDRYGEYRPDIPLDADFVAQARDDETRPRDYFWWLGEPAGGSRSTLRPERPDVDELRGHLDLVQPERISGWVQYVRYPETPVSVDIYAAGALLGRVVADRYRADLRQAGLGSGRHSFDFSPPAGSRFSAGSVQLRCAAFEPQGRSRIISLSQ